MICDICKQEAEDDDEGGDEVVEALSSSLHEGHTQPNS